MRIYFFINQKVFVRNGIKIKYIYIPGQGELLVNFAAFPGHKERSKYNYVRTLKSFRCNKLFILDDFGYYHTGSYYFGDSMQVRDNEVIESLIKEIMSSAKVTRLVFCGSSKGGSSALYYGLKMKADAVICGSPQYNILQYLQQNEYHKHILDAITNREPENELFLSQCIKKQLQENQGATKIYLMSSTEEPSYETDIKYLLEDMSDCHINFYFEKANYKIHSELSKVFPIYLTNILHSIENELH